MARHQLRDGLDALDRAAAEVTGAEVRFHSATDHGPGFGASLGMDATVGDDLAVLNDAAPTDPAEEPYIREGVLPREGRSVRLVLSRFPAEAATSTAAHTPAKEGSP